MNFELFRLETFSSWPVNAPVSKERLAKAGFFYLKENLRVKCFDCNLEIDNWEFGDQVITRHRTLNPNCEFVRSELGSSNVSLEVVNATTLQDAAARLITFKQWPKESIIKSEDLVAAGFYYLNIEDRTKCVCCNGVVVNWEANDIPKVIHTILHPFCPLVRKFMENEEYRKMSFKNWPKPNVDIENLAKAGFFYGGKSDSTKCFSCGGISCDWSENDIPDKEHKRLFPNCKFVQNVIEPRLNGSVSINIKPEDPVYPEYETVNARFQSYENLPESCTQSAKDLAEAGFFYTGKEDLVTCYHCNGKLQNWHEDDIPWIEHAKWFPNCFYVNINKSSTFIENCKALQGSETSISNFMTNDMTKEALALGIEEKLIKKAILDHVKLYGCSFSKTEDLVDKVFSSSEGTSSSTEFTAVAAAPIVAELYQENRALKDAKLCKICMDTELQIVFLPCGHFSTCDSCSNIVSECPICRKPIEKRIKTFLS